MQTATPPVRRKQSLCGPITSQQLISSNETSNHFLGTTQRAWMVTSTAVPPSKSRDRLPSNSSITTPTTKPTKSAPTSSVHASFKSSGKFDHLAPLTRPVEQVAIENVNETAKEAASKQQVGHGTTHNNRTSEVVQRAPGTNSDNTRSAKTNTLEGNAQTKPFGAKEQRSASNVLHQPTSRNARPSPIPESPAVRELQIRLPNRPIDTGISTVNGSNVSVRMPLPSPISASDMHLTSAANGLMLDQGSPAEHNFESTQQQRQLMTPISSPMETHLGRKRSFPQASNDLPPATRQRLQDQTTHKTPMLPPAGLAVSSNPSRPAENSVPNREVPLVPQVNRAQQHHHHHHQQQQQPTPNKANSYLLSLETTLREMSTRFKFDRTSEFRIAWVKEACMKGDFFFLLLHQLVCMSTIQKPVLETRFGITLAHYEGFLVFEALFEKNDALPAELLAYFAGFPNSPYMLDVSPELYHWVGIIKDFLLGLQRRWELLKLRCINRCFPPSALEIEEVLRCPRSVVLPRAFFSSVDRQIFPNYDAIWANKTYQFFQLNQQHLFSQMQASEMQTLDPSPREQEHEFFGAAYQRLRNEHEQQRTHCTRSHATSIQEGSHRHTQYRADIPQMVGRENQEVSVPLLRAAAPEGGEGVQNVSASRGPIQSEFNTTFSPSGHRQQQMQYGRQLGWPRFAYLRGAVDWRHMASTTPNASSPSVQTRPTSYPDRSNPQNWAALTTQLSSYRSNLPVQQGLGNRPMVFTTPFTSNSMLPASPIGVARASIQLLPELSQIPPLITNPDPLRVALHQAHLATPISCLKGTADTSNFKLYQYIASFAMKPFLLSAKQPFATITFSISQAELDRMAVYARSDSEFSGIQKRYVADRTTLLNLRCIEVGKDMLTPNESQWSSSSTSYPQHCFISINDRHLELRRRRHFKKDLPVDVTPFIRPGNNTVVLSTHPTPDEAMKLFAIGVEIVELSSYERAFAMPKKIESRESLSKIVEHLEPDYLDEDLVIDNSHISIDLKDPFTSKLVRLPVRGKTCLHRECFDLEAFLQSRTCEARDNLTEVYQWLCPYCKRDVRPSNLVIDGFLFDVSKHLTSIGKTDTIAIHVKEDGNWEAKTCKSIEQEDTNLNHKNKPEEMAISQPTTPNQQLHTPVSAQNAFSENFSNHREPDHFQRGLHSLEIVELD